MGGTCSFAAVLRRKRIKDSRLGSLPLEIGFPVTQTYGPNE